jgi:hypothetical protein
MRPRGDDPSNVLQKAARSRRLAWFATVRLNVWTFDASAAYAAAIRVLVGRSASPMDAYLAAGALLDVAEGRGPSGAVRLPMDWRALPGPVATVLGLPGLAREWDDRGRHVPGDESIRAAAVIAAECEAEGDDTGRAVFDAIVRDRSRPKAIVHPRKPPFSVRGRSRFDRFKNQE